MAQDDLLALTARAQCRLNDVVNSWGFRQISVDTGFQGAALIDEWQASCQSNWLAMVASSVTLNTLSARKVYPGLAEVAEETLSSGNVGGVALEAAPNQLAAIITWRTQFAGRSYRGRTYVPAIAEDNLDDGLVDGIQLARMATFVSNMLAAFGPSGTSTKFRFVILSRFNGGLPRPNPVGTQVTAGVPRAIPGVIRKRRIGVGS